jgi:hypothetical protein
VQQKYGISEENLKELKNIFISDENLEREENLLESRYRSQVHELTEIIKDQQLPALNNLLLTKELLEPRMQNRESKQELKRYEKELEMKAGKGFFHALEDKEKSFPPEDQTAGSMNLPYSLSNKRLIDREKSSFMDLDAQISNFSYSNLNFLQSNSNINMYYEEKEEEMIYGG